MSDLYVDPELEKLIKSRIIPSVETPNMFDGVLVKRSNFYGIHAQPQSEVIDVLKHLLVDKDYVYYPKLDDKSHGIFKDHTEGSLVVIEDAVFFPIYIEEAKECGAVFIVINTKEKFVSHPFWKEYFDWEFVFGLPPKEFIKDLFIHRFEQFAEKYKDKDIQVSLTPDDYEQLALSADSCTRKDVLDFLKMIFVDVICNKERLITLDWIREQGYFIEVTTQKYSLITDRNPYAEQGKYALEPSNKRLRLK